MKPGITELSVSDWMLYLFSQKVQLNLMYKELKHWMICPSQKGIISNLQIYIEYVREFFLFCTDLTGCLGLVDALVRVSSALNHIFQGMRTKLEVFNQY